MEATKLLSGVVAAAMVLGTGALCAFAEGTTIPAGDAASLIQAFSAAQNGDTIQLTDDIATQEQIVVAADKTVTLDLAGHSIDSTYHSFVINNQGTLTINDTVGGGCVFNSSHQAVSIDGVIYGHDTVRNFGTLTINGGTFGDSDTDRTNKNDVQYGAAVRNQTGATCYINGGFFTCADNYGKWEGELTESFFSYAIRSYGTMEINGGTVYGSMNGGVAADAGIITINDGSFTVSDANGQTPYYVLVRNTGEPGGTIVVNDGTFIHEGSRSNLVLGGFSGMPSWDASGNLTENGFAVYGGTFGVSLTGLPEGYECIDNGNNTYTVRKIPVASSSVTYTGAEAISYGDTNELGAIRYTFDATVSETDSIGTFGAYILPLSIFQSEKGTDNAVNVQFNEPLTDGESFSADIIDIPFEKFEMDIYALPYIIKDGSIVTFEGNSTTVTESLGSLGE